MLRVACPTCSKSLGLPDTAAGKTVKCPQCQQLFKAPMAPAAPKKTAAPAKADNRTGYDEEATPYELKNDAITSQDMKRSAAGEAVDAMVTDAARLKKRNKAWEAIGTPAKFMKRFALTACVVWLCTYCFLTMIIVLCNHNMEQAEKTGGFLNTGGVKSKPKYLFISEAFDLSTDMMPPLRFWLIVTGGLIVALSIYGLQLAAAESMKKLENYRLSMAGAIVGAFTINLFGLWCLLVLTDKSVQYEFRVSKRRLEGKIGDELYNEGTDDDEDDEEDEAEEDEDEEEEVQPAGKRRKAVK